MTQSRLIPALRELRDALVILVLGLIVGAVAVVR